VSRHVSSEAVAAYRPVCTKLANQLNGVQGAEFDDLYQEGLIAAWMSLQNGIAPSNTFIKNRMLDWVRKCRRRGFSGYEDT
jgi:DNA-directed RNA polymerase specialized sigma24 family protein